MNIITALALLVAAEFIEVHGPDGQVAFINTNEITTMRAPGANDRQRFFPKGTNCIIVTTSGKFIGVVETCGELRNQIEKNNENQTNTNRG